MFEYALERVFISVLWNSQVGVPDVGEDSNFLDVFRDYQTEDLVKEKHTL